MKGKVRLEDILLGYGDVVMIQRYAERSMTSSGSQKSIRTIQNPGETCWFRGKAKGKVGSGREPGRILDLGAPVTNLGQLTSLYWGSEWRRRSFQIKVHGRR